MTGPLTPALFITTTPVRRHTCLHFLALIYARLCRPPNHCPSAPTAFQDNYFQTRTIVHVRVCQQGTESRVEGTESLVPYRGRVFSQPVFTLNNDKHRFLPVIVQWKNLVHSARQHPLSVDAQLSFRPGAQARNAGYSALACTREGCAGELGCSQLHRNCVPPAGNAVRP
jgi:hypothetical protein